MEMLGAEFVLDEFHIQKYIRRMARLGSGGREEEVKNLKEWFENGNRKNLEEWAAQKCATLTEKEGKKLMESWNYIKNNWKGVRKRIKKRKTSWEAARRGISAMRCQQG